MEKLSKGNALFRDFCSSIVVFLVAVPLCLGIAQASKVESFAGIIAGIVGGIVIGLLSKSPLSVSGPAAGLTTVVIASFAELGKAFPQAGNLAETDLVRIYMPTFCLAVFLAGIIQIIIGAAKLGFLGNYVPTAVIKGMLAAIGIILIITQFPHFLGRDRTPEIDEPYSVENNENMFRAIVEAIKHPTIPAIIIGAIGILILLLWETKFFKKHKIFLFFSGPLVVVILGIVLGLVLNTYFPTYQNLEEQHFVKMTKSASEFFNSISLPEFSNIKNLSVWKIALTLALVASLETLLSIEAIDKLDPWQRNTPTNRELVAQGVGNSISGLLGGLPVTSVIVRSSANVNSGAYSKLSTILHGSLLLLSATLFPHILNYIPKAALAAILFMTGFKLAKPAIFVDLFKKGFDQIIPFVGTIIAIVATDLLKGVFIGILISLIFIIRSNYRTSITRKANGNDHVIKFSKEVSFLNKLKIKNILDEVPEGSNLTIDCSECEFMDYDIQEEIKEYVNTIDSRNINLSFKSNGNKNFIFLKNVIKLNDTTVN